MNLVIKKQGLNLMEIIMEVDINVKIILKIILWALFHPHLSSISKCCYLQKEKL
jgi:hypothetical protein